MVTLLEKAMFEGLVQSYRNDMNPDLLALMDSLNQGDRSALFALSDYYREQGQEDKANMYLWCWKMNRWPRLGSITKLKELEGKWHFNGGKISEQVYGYENGVSEYQKWGIRTLVFQATASETIFGCFCNFYEKMWSKCPEHTAKLMHDLPA